MLDMHLRVTEYDLHSLNRAWPFFNKIEAGKFGKFRKYLLVFSYHGNCLLNVKVIAYMYKGNMTQHYMQRGGRVKGKSVT